jgi:hypothetical protein
MSDSHMLKILNKLISLSGIGNILSSDSDNERCIGLLTTAMITKFRRNVKEIIS